MATVIEIMKRKEENKKVEDQDWARHYHISTPSNKRTGSFYQQWYLPEVINDTEGDAEVIPFPVKKE